MIEIIFETIIILIFRYPGALLRWLFLGGKRSFKSILEDDAYINAIFSLIFIAIIVVLVRFIFF